MTHLKELVDMGLQDWTTEATVQEDGVATNVLNLLNDLQSSMDYLYQSQNDQTLHHLSRKCLLHIYVLMMRVIHQDLSGADSHIKTAQENWQEKIMRKLQTVIDPHKKDEKNICQECEKLGGKRNVNDGLPTFSQLESSIQKLLVAAAKVIEPPPACPCKFMKTYQSLSSHGQVEEAASLESSEPVKQSRTSELLKTRDELLSDSRPSKMSDLHQIAGSDLDEDELEQRAQDIQRKIRRMLETDQGRTPEKKFDQKRKRLSDKTNEVSSKKRYSPKKRPSPKKSQYFSDSDSDVAGSPEETKKTTSSPHVSSSSASDSRKKLFKPPLSGLIRRDSLINFGKSRKPPSHTRAKTGKWTPEEEEDFIAKTMEIGEGNWVQIKAATQSLRSTVQLKDKWRQIAACRPSLRS